MKITGYLLLFAALTASAADLPRFKWQNFTTENGLPDNRVYAVTDNGLGLYQNGQWKCFGVADGLPQRAVLSLALDKRTHDLWIGTMGGLGRYSAGRFDSFTQLTSGLPNDVVYGVSVLGDAVWVATAAGGARLNTRTHQWSLYNERNTPMYEIWTYSVTAAEDKVYYAVWGGGVLEYDVKTDHWKDYNDPDGENEIVLFKDQGLIHEITTSVSYVKGILWVATYFGASRYDGRNWQNFLEKDSGMPSNFLNQVKSTDGTRAWFSTDKGLAYYDGERWATYRPSLETHAPEMLVRDAKGAVTRVPVDSAPSREPRNSNFNGRFKQMNTLEMLDQIASATSVKKHAITHLGVLNEAYDYPKPSSFSRGLRMDVGGVAILLISGTASIDENGQSVHIGDFKAQLRRTYHNITGLLEAEGATWKDIVRTSCYLRDIERDYAAFNEGRTAFFRELGLDPLPASTGIQAIL